MPSSFALSVVSPARSVVEETVTSVVAPGSEGYFGVNAGHVPIIASLKPGTLEYVEVGGMRRYVYVAGGFAEVSGARVTILADEATPAPEIDLAKAEVELEHARRALRGEDAPLKQEEAVEVVERAVQKLKTARIGR
jgi:F-type H+-transporting ATPase subunit epsilon